MKLQYIELSWSHAPPDFFREEIVACLPSQVDINGSLQNMNSLATEIREHRCLDGTPGKLMGKIEEDIGGTDLYNLLPRMGLDAVRRIRFAGESLTTDSWRFIREFSLNAMTSNMSITIETSLAESESFELLEKILRIQEKPEPRSSFIDNMVIKVRIPETVTSQFEDKITVILNSLVSCIIAIDSMLLGKLSLCVLVDEKSSIEVINKLFGTIKTACTKDDRFSEEGMKMLAMSTFDTIFLPLSTRNELNELITKARNFLLSQGFDENRILIIHPFMTAMSIA
jgi:hypothetical protein